MQLPNFLKLPVYAFDISDKSYKYLLLKETKRGVEVADFGGADIPDGVMDRGEIKKPDVLASQLRALFELHNIKYASFALPEEKGFLRTIKLSGVKEGEIGKVLEFQLEEHVPLPAAEAVFNYTVSKKDGDRYDVVLSAFPKRIVEAYLDVFSEAGALPVYIESELNASVAAVVPRDFKKTTMLIDWGHTRTSFSIVDEGILRFTTTVPIGGTGLDEAIAKGLNVGLTKAESLKQEKGFVKNTSSTEVFEAMVPLVSAFREEVEKYINYWQSHSEKREAPERIFLYGGESNLTGFREYLAKQLNIEVSLADPWVNVPFPARYLPEIEMKDSLRFATSIGLSLNTLKENKFL
ncbi:MAG: Type IV pilus assembly protein PilM [Candidatus Giovannonibacteria bacterium GW2011_GWA2_44_13b]|uniref:Type IV pilus assembly protein PilM n=2 Tax=Candidatus Giovannoniibacteriota TaxID=1752738 RepID=A0A0G1K2V6_9BACT|nr:MAG: Type IV pilus assembly protein PilM [Candidatus Giovannonibacteria bacterium GW2011_GWA2_44_13b]OGF81603.1 MAG: hypothetical protein A2924_02555 [Candidatus Giovannonibacteria bacterium RIFCSPLOWO2_01_FULL_44_16]